MRSIAIYGASSIANRQKALEMASGLLNNSEHIESNSHPDFLLIKPAGDQILIEDARRINEFANLKPIAGKNKVILVEDIDLLSPNAANAILKTLEEPEENVTFLLTTTKISAILPTIRSRCIKLKVQTELNEDFNEHYQNYLLTDSDPSFTKKYAEDCFDFVKFCMFYCYRHLRGNYNYALKISRLQTLLNLTKTTYPNKEYVIMLARHIVN